MNAGREGRTLPAVLATVLLAAACAPGAPEGSDATGPSNPASELTVAWERPTVDAEGDSLGDLAGFRIYVAEESPVERERAEMVEVGDTSRHTFSDFGPGVYYLAVSAVDTAGNESELSEELRVEVEGT